MNRLSNILFQIIELLLRAISADSGPRGQKPIVWGRCTELDSNETIQCANLTVPLDYTLPNSSETIELQLLRLPAARQPSKGSILFNFGGPGIAARPMMAQKGAVLRNSTSEYHDLVTFDPRGTGNTLPFRCFADEDEKESYLVENPSYWSSILASNFWANSSHTNPGRLWISTKLYADKCYEKNKESGGVHGTAFVARDMIQIVDALGEDGLLRYWGASYGTILGQTAAAMFPERIDKMVLDANLNGHEYYHTFDDEQFTDADKAFSATFQSCIDQSTCALAERNMTTADLEDAAYALIDELNARPILYENLVIDYNVVKLAILETFYDISHRPSLTKLLYALMFEDYEVLADLMTHVSLVDPLIDSDLSLSSSADALIAIKCGDKVARVSTLNEFLPIMKNQMGKSRILGDAQIMVEMICAQWKLNAKESYSGDFDVKTRNPILFIGNTADGIAPLASARNMSAAFEGSVVLQVNGSGHGSVGRSNCVAKVTAEYLVDGTLPENETFCELDAPTVLEAGGDDS